MTGLFHVGYPFTAPGQALAGKKESTGEIRFLHFQIEFGGLLFKLKR
jgi:hypothetical protein